MLEELKGRGRPRWILPFVVLACAAFLRAAYLILYARTIPLYSVPLVDAKIYAGWAERIASGDWLSAGEGVFYRAPLYPYFLAGVQLIFGNGVPWAYILQLLMGLGILLVSWRLAIRLGGQSGGLLAIVLLTLYGPLMAAESKLLTTTLGLFLHLLSVWASVRFAEGQSRATGLAAGIFLGLASLVRPQWIVLTPLIPLLLAQGRRRLLRWWPFVLGVILMVAPVTVRNRIAGDDWVLISSNGGMTFFQGNNDENKSGLLTVVRRFELFGSAVHQRDLERRAAERETGHSMKPSEISSFWMRQGMEFIVSRPADWLGLQARKLYRVLTSHEYADNYSFYFERERLWPLRVTFLPFGALLALGVLGSIWRRSARRDECAVMSSAALGILSCLVFFVSSRYRMDSVPALAILGGAALARLPQQLITTGKRRWIGPMSAAMVFSASFLPAGPPARSQESISYLQVGTALEAQGRLGEAEEVYGQAVDMLPSNVLAWNSLALLVERLRGADNALAVLSEAPADPILSHPMTQNSIGYLHMRLEMDDEAAVWLERALRADPLMIEAHERLASIREKQRRFGAAESHLLEAIALSPSRADLWARLGYSRIQLREYSSAGEAYEEVLRLRPDDIDAVLNLAICEFHTGDLEESMARLSGMGKAVEEDPLALYYRGLLTWRMSGHDPGSSRSAVSDLGRVLEMEPGNFRALYYGTMARLRAGDDEDLTSLWGAAWGQDIVELLPALLDWLKDRSAMGWGVGLTAGEERALRLHETTPLGSLVTRRIRETIAEE